MSEANFPPIVEDSDEFKHSKTPKGDGKGDIDLAKALEDMKKELAGIDDKYSDKNSEGKSSTGRMVDDAIKPKKDDFKMNEVKLSTNYS